MSEQRKARPAVPDYIRKEQTRVQGSGELGGGKVSWWKAKVGRNVVRVLPPKDDDRYYFGTRQHFIPGDAGKDLPVVCLREDPKRQDVKICPLCQYAAELEGNDLKGKSRYYMNIIDRAAEDEGVQVLACGSRMHLDILSIFSNPDWNMDITDPESGVDVVIQRVGKTRNDTRYTVGPRRMSTSVKFETDQLVDLNSLVMQVDFEELEGMAEELKEKGSVSRPGASEEESGKDEENKIEEVKKEETKFAKGKKTKKEDKTPKCIGRLDPEDELCKECEFSEECEEIVVQGKKETGEKSGSLKNRMKE